MHTTAADSNDNSADNAQEDNHDTSEEIEAEVNDVKEGMMPYVF